MLVPASDVLPTAALPTARSSLACKGRVEVVDATGRMVIDYVVAGHDRGPANTEMSGLAEVVRLALY